MRSSSVISSAGISVTASRCSRSRDMSAARYLVTPDEIGAELVTKLVGDIKLPERQINGSSYKAHYISAGVEWRRGQDSNLHILSDGGFQDRCTTIMRPLRMATLDLQRPCAGAPLLGLEYSVT